MIKKRLKQYTKWFNWRPDAAGCLSKSSLHHHHCAYCNGEHYKREKFDWRSEIAQ
jgi:hypothetical protein